MIKNAGKILLTLATSMALILSSITSTFASSDDFATIKSRLKEFIVSQDTFDDGAKVETCRVSEAEKYYQLIQEDGSFKDVDYDATESAANGVAWSPYLALDRLQAIAIAYHVEGNPLYKKADVIEKLNKAIVHWSKVNPTSKNWWENQIGVQLRFSRIALVMDGIMSEEAMNIMLHKLLEKTPEKKGTGQNNLWFDQNYVYYAIITENGKKYKDSLGTKQLINLKELVDNYLSYCLVVQTNDHTSEAVQVDNSFYMHGRQFYSNGYGLSMFRDMSYWLYMLRDTQFEFHQDVVDLMADYMLGGTSWTIRGDIMEIYLGYRPYDSAIGYTNYAFAYILPLQRMMQVDKKRAHEYQNVLDNVLGKNKSNGKNGNYYMWRSGYASHMRDSYGVNIKMDSNQIIGGEWRGSWTGQEDGGQLIYWTSSASSTISVDGDEYIDVFPTYDWAHVPGTTTESRIVKDYSNYGRFTNGTEHTIGVSNGKYGATAYDMNKKGTKAKKGYFFFDDEFVALGSGIESSEDVEIHTTLNQSKANHVLVDGKSVDKGTQNKKYNAKWLYNDDIGYVFLDNTDVVVSNSTQKDNPSLWSADDQNQTPETFKAYLNHGKKPKNDHYAYVVIPNKSESDVKKYANQKMPIEVLANDETVQAVRHNGLKQTQINFYKSGSLDCQNGCKITVDQPCSLIIDESTSTRQISLAVHDANANQVVNVDIDDHGHQSRTTFVSGQLPYAGQTLTLTEASDNRYNASSQIKDHEVSKIFDGNEQTYWQSESQDNQWISAFVGDNTHLSTMNITWGENWAQAYDVLVSQDGKNYTLLTSVEKSDGNTDSIELNGVYPYVKIQIKNGQKNYYQIKEIQLTKSQSLALNKKVEVSSTSTNDPSNTKEKINDGNASTRWSSLRNEDDNWVTIDLGQYSQIDAMNIQWEGACSDDYDIMVSSDNRNWINVKEDLKTADNLLDEYSFKEPVYGRYVKIHSHKSRQLKYGISIYEVSIYGKGVDEDIAFQKNTFSSSTKDLNLPTHATDHQSKTSWISQNNDNQWIYVELKGIYEISSMSIDWGNDYATDYEVQISDDTKTWKTICTIKNGKGHHEEIKDLGNQKAKYVRLKFNQSNASSYQIVQWSVHGKLIDASSSKNIALNKPATASSVYKDVYQASRAFDGSFENQGGDNQSRWVSFRQKDTQEDMNDQWIQVDLEQLYDIDGVKLYWEGNGAKEYEILVSEDGKDWQQAYLEKAGMPGIAEIKFDTPMTARYVKMHGIKCASQYGYSLWEFEVYGDVHEEPVEPAINVALHKESIASSEFTDVKDGNKTYESSLAFDGKGNGESVDGNKASRWVSERTKENPDALNEWIYVDLGDIYDINKVVLNWEGAGAKQYKVQVSEDGKDWKDIVIVEDGDGGVDELSIDNAFGRYVKMQGIEPGGIYGYSLWEFEVYGTSLKSLLKESYDKYKNMDVSSFTPNSVNEYQKALENAMNIYNKADATSNDIISAIEQLENSVNNLIKIADTIDLKQAIDNANQYLNSTKYTPESLNKLKALMSQAEAILIDKNTSQETVDKMVNQLKTAIDNLVEKADKTDLLSIYDQAVKLDKEKYTMDSFQNLESILKKAEIVINNENVTQQEVDEMYEKINRAISQLEEIDPVEESDDSQDVSVDHKPDVSVEEDKEVEKTQPSQVLTQDSTPIYVLCALMCISLGGYFFIKKSKY